MDDTISDTQMVQDRSGHRSKDAVRRYKRPGSQLLQSVSDCLQPPNPKTVNTQTSVVTPSTSNNSRDEWVAKLPGILNMVKESGLKCTIEINDSGISIKPEH